MNPNQNKPEQNNPMDAQTMLTNALAAGAVLTLEPNQRDLSESLRNVEPVYLKLKELIREQYGQVDIDLLDIGPGSVERRQAISQQLQKAGATENEAVMRQAQVLLNMIAEENPTALWAAKPAEPPFHLK